MEPDEILFPEEYVEPEVIEPEVVEPPPYPPLTGSKESSYALIIIPTSSFKDEVAYHFAYHFINVVTQNDVEYLKAEGAWFDYEIEWLEEHAEELGVSIFK